MNNDAASTNPDPAGSLLRLSGWGRLSSTIRGLLLIGTTLIIFYLLFRQIDLSSVVLLLSKVPAWVWITSTLLTLSFPVMSAMRWRLILGTMGYYVPMQRCLLIIIGIWPLSSISPSKAGDLLKAVSLRRDIKPAIVAGSVLTERTLDVLVLSAFALVGGLIFGDFRISIMAGCVAGAVISALAIAKSNLKLPVSRKLQSTLGDLLRSLRLLGSQPWLLFAVLGLTVANWLASIVQTKILFHGVGASVPIGFAATALPIAIFAGLLPVTFGGMATRDSAMVILFAAFATGSQALAVGLLYSFFGYWLLAAIGIPYIKKALNF